MHELGIVIGIIDTLDGIKEEKKLSEISAVLLEVGELSGVIPDYLSECWRAATLESRYEKTELRLTFIPAKGRCENCKTEFELMKNNRQCPTCRKSDYQIIDGKQFDINEIIAK